MQLISNVSKSEFLLYLSVWSSSVLYAVICFAENSQKYFQYYDDYYSDFSEGWGILSKKQDTADYEWKVSKVIFMKLCLWIFFSIIITEIIRTLKRPKLLQLWRVCITLTFISYELGYFSVFAIFAQPLIFISIIKKPTKAIIWICSCLCLILISIYKHFSIQEGFLAFFHIDEQTVYITMLALFWTNLRCVSYFIDVKEVNTLEMLSYCIYLPTALCGPFISYNDFKTNTRSDLKSRLYKLALDFVRFLLWIAFLELFLHLIYVNAAGFHPEWVKNLDSWPLFGYGYAMGQFFHIKYVVIYGLSTTIAKFEDIIVPSLPICIGRVHLYSDMWKYFDAGLYNFLSRYIYFPLMNIKAHRLFASFICFGFVYIWHGIDHYIFVWTVLNYIGLAIENIILWVTKKANSKMKPQWAQRFSCFCATPLLVLSAVSNFYFFARSEIGEIFLSRLIKGSLQSNLILILILYTCCQVSTELRARKIKYKNK